jgi:Homeodomain-like domain
MAMLKKYIVRLTEQERRTLWGIVRKFKGSSAKVRRAQVLLKADVDGPQWTDQRIADAFGCRTRTIEYLRQRLVTQGFDAALEKKQPESPPRAKLLDGPQEAKIIAMRLGKPPKGFANWSLRLLAEQVVELGIIDRVSHETLRTTLKKTRMANLTGDVQITARITGPIRPYTAEKP